MKRLIQRGLMFGNLFHVSSPALVERYNRALHHLTGMRTELTDFHYADKSDEVAIEAMVRDFGRNEEAKKRFLEGEQ